MSDQADTLRQLIDDDADGRRRYDRASFAATRLVAVVGATPGVGATTLAVHLAMTLARSRRETVLVDADPQQPDIAARFAVAETHTINEALSGRRPVAKCLGRAPIGLRLLCGAAQFEAHGWPAPAHERLIADLKAPAVGAEFVIVDLGVADGAFAERVTRSADEVLVTMTPDNESVTAAYAAIKRLSKRRAARFGTLVNCAQSVSQARDVHVRIAAACLRFLDLDVDAAGDVPFDDRFGLVANLREHWDLCPPPAAQRMSALASHVASIPAHHGRRAPRRVSERMDHAMRGARQPC